MGLSFLSAARISNVFVTRISVGSLNLPPVRTVRCAVVPL